MSDDQGTTGPEEPTAPVPPPSAEPPADESPMAPPPVPPAVPPGPSTVPPVVAGPDDLPEPAKSRKTLWWVLGISAAVLLVVVGVGAWAVVRFLLPSGAPVTSALPDSTLAFAAIDLDPSASQKVAALDFMRKFPGLTKDAKFDTQTNDNLTQWLTSTIANDPTCANFDFQTQIAPWIGSRAAVAGAPNADGNVTPFGVIQVTDAQKAKDAIANDFGCTPDPSSPPPAVAVVGDYIVLADKQADADYFAQLAQTSPLTGDATYTALMAKLGDPGIVQAYASPALVTQYRDQIDQGMSSDLMGSAYGDQLNKELDSFQGAVAVVRFDGSALELKAMVTADLSSGAVPAPTTVADLPASTIFAMGVGYAPGSAKATLSTYWDSLQQNDPTYQSDIRMIEQQTGLKLPDDLYTLFDSGYVFAVDSSLDPNVFSSPSMPDGSQLPMGLRFTGDTQAIYTVLDKLSRFAGENGLPLAVEKGDSSVAISMSSEYAKKLAGTGDLGTSPSYQGAVVSDPAPNTVLYLDMGAVHDWVQALDTSDPSLSDVLDNLAPLDAFGESSYQDGSDTYLDMRLTTH